MATAAALTVTIEDAARFWSGVEKAPRGCWVWTRTRKNRGYGVISIGGVNRAAHRIAYHIAVGPLVAGLVVCHRCDNPACVNPNHLFQGSYAENARDCIAKGRFGRARTPAGTRCRRGHEFTADNARFSADGKRRCRACERLRGH